MNRLCSALLWTSVLIVAASAAAQTGNGYVGIYRDSLGTQACASVPEYTGTTLYVIAKTSGQSADGITGAEFRIEVRAPSGWYISYNPPSAANIVSGDPIDTDPDADVGGGLNLAFPSCQVPADSGLVKLGTLSVFNAGGSPTNLLVKRHSHPSNAGFACPLFVECDEPYYTKVCMTTAPQDSCTLGNQKASVTLVDDPTVFTASLNEGSTDPGQEPGHGGSVVLAEFVPGTMSLPAGHTKASLASVTINSDAVRAVLENHNVTAVGKTFPNWTLADTLGYDRFGQPVRHANLSQHYILTVPSGRSATALAADLAAASRQVVFAEPDGGVGLDTDCQYGNSSCPIVLHLPNCPQDQEFQQQWSLLNWGQPGQTGQSGICREDIHAGEAWEITTGDSTTIIGVLNSGVDTTNPDVGGKAFGDLSAPWSWHGTAVACIAAAWSGVNDIGVVGVDWKARVYSLKLLDTDFPVDTLGTDTTIVNAIRAADAHGVHVLNNSWDLIHWDSTAGRYSSEVRLAFRDFYMDKRIAVAAMGNDFGPFVNYPAAFGQGIIAVGSTTKDGNKAEHSTTGRHIDVVAPGEEIWVPYWTNCWHQWGYDYYGGTSFATPHVSGLAGLMLAVKDSLEPDDVEQIICLSADSIGSRFNSSTGWGRINAKRALDFLRPPNEFMQSSEVGGVQLASDWSGFVHFEYLPPGVPDSVAIAVRYPVEKTVSFSRTFQSPPRVWGRGTSTVGYSDDGSTSGVNHVNFGMGWCGPIGSISNSSCRLRTYVYDLRDKDNKHLGWAPTDAQHVVFAYSVLSGANVPPPTDIGDEATNGTSARLALQSQNPLRAGGALQVSLPRKAHARIEIFNVAGRRVAVIYNGILEPGKHTFTWQAHDLGGTSFASGLYFARVEADGQRVTRKLILIQ